MNTKLKLLAGLATGFALQLCPLAMADPVPITVASGPLNVLIPDNNLSGVASQVNFNSAISQITSVTVTVNVAGAPPNDPNAWDGDYVAYLEYDSVLVYLLQNPGTPPYGSPGNGFNITFSDAAGVNPLNLTSDPNLNTTATISGTYNPAGNLGAFNGLNPNGTWTMFIADTSAGDIGTLTSWSMSVAGLPDSAGTFLLLTIGVGLLGLYSAHSMRLPRPAPIKISRARS